MILFYWRLFCCIMISRNETPSRVLCISLANTEKHKILCVFHHRCETNITICYCLIIYQRHSVLQHNTALWTTPEPSIHMVKRLSCHKNLAYWRMEKPSASSVKPSRRIYYGAWIIGIRLKIGMRERRWRRSLRRDVVWVSLCRFFFWRKSVKIDNLLYQIVSK